MSAAVVTEALIDGKTYRLTFKFGTMRIAEAELGKPITAELASGEVTLAVLSCLFWAVLQPHHRMSRDGADDLVDAAGLEQVGKWIGEGLGLYFNRGVSKEDQVAAGEPAAAGKGKAAK